MIKHHSLELGQYALSTRANDHKGDQDKKLYYKATGHSDDQEPKSNCSVLFCSGSTSKNINATNTHAPIPKLFWKYCIHAMENRSSFKNKVL